MNIHIHIHDEFSRFPKKKYPSPNVVRPFSLPHLGITGPQDAQQLVVGDQVEARKGGALRVQIILRWICVGSGG